MEPKELKSLIRLILFVAGFAAVFALLNQLNIIPAAVATASPDKLGAVIDGETVLSAPGRTASGGIQLLIAAIAGGFCVWKFGGPIANALTGGQASPKTNTSGRPKARDVLKSMARNGLSPAERAQFAGLMVQAAEEGDFEALRVCANKLHGKSFIAKRVDTSANPNSAEQK